MSEPIFSVQDLTMRFGGLTAVDRVSFELYPNQILAVIGPNGAGKTTVFNVVTGLYAPSEGAIRFKGSTINGLAPHLIARRGIKRTFQQSRLFDNLPTLAAVLATARRCWPGLLTVKIRLGRDTAGWELRFGEPAPRFAGPGAQPRH